MTKSKEEFIRVVKAIKDFESQTFSNSYNIQKFAGSNNVYECRYSKKGRFYYTPFSNTKQIIYVEADHDHTIVKKWIVKNKEYVVRYLRGLYEAEGSFCVHKPTYTHKFLFANKNVSMLNNVYDLMQGLGFHPHRGKYQIQISKKDEVYKAMKVLEFRDYK